MRNSFSTPQLLSCAHGGNNKGSGELHEKAISNWFSTETMKHDFDWRICRASIAQREFIGKAKAMFRFQNKNAKVAVGVVYKVLKLTCAVIVLLIKLFVSPRSCCRRHRGLHEKQE